MSSTTNIYSQNVCKNYVLVDNLLETQKDLYNILFKLFVHLWDIQKRQQITEISDH